MTNKDEHEINDGDEVKATAEDEAHTSGWLAEQMSGAWNKVLVLGAESYVELRLAHGTSPQIIGTDEAGMLESFQDLLALSDRAAADLRHAMEPSVPPLKAQTVAQRRWVLAEMRRGSFDRYAAAVRSCLQHHDLVGNGGRSNDARRV